MLRNNIAFATDGLNNIRIDLASQSHNAGNGGSWGPGGAVLPVSAADFQSLDDAVARGSRQADGALPAIAFLRLAEGSRLIGAGSPLGLPPHLLRPGSMPSLGALDPL